MKACPPQPGLLLPVLLLTLWPLVWSGPGLAEPVLEVIDLRYREAEALIPLLEPLLGGDARLSGRGFQLIVRAEPVTLAELRRLLTRLDTPADNLLISVRFDEASQETRSRARVDGRVVIDDGRVRGSGRVVLGQGGASRRGQVDQQLRVLEGYEALIQVSREVLRRSYWGDYLDQAVTGFRVRPRVSGERVTLDLTVQRERLAGRGSRGAVADTALSGRLGEWIPVALSADGQLLAGSGGGGRGASGIFMWVRVERL